MNRKIVAFSLPKVGETEQNIQDRFASSSDGSLVALSDGAGSSLYPSQWAEILVNGFCQSGDGAIATIQQSHREWLKPLQEEWRQYYLAKLTDPNRKWWQGGSQLKNHGAATFLGFQLSYTEGSAEGQWQALAVGDSCLFQRKRDSDDFLVFPVQHSQLFKGTTQCFASLPEYSSFEPKFTEGSYGMGDSFLLATDALAQWILADRERQGEQWKNLFSITESAVFSQAIAQLRDERKIKNDDTTMVLINIIEEVERETETVAQKKPRRKRKTSEN